TGDIGLPGFGRLAVSFLIIAGLIYAFVYFMKRFFMKSGGRGKGSLELVGSLTLGQKSKLCIVKAGERTLLIGVTGQQINSLAELDPSELEDGSDKINQSPSFISYLRKSVSGAEGDRRSATG
ncbi:MAG: flagellar biosynthetic protein FliO, partial [Candidatus Latescibacteria bacterium]|nr:flagellar biosynthetic protein FliO [bacterium]MBD3424922.1 flagellar biosynthetic protein FliO [Candidatus Latescibacterota bacterium]